MNVEAPCRDARRPAPLRAAEAARAAANGLFKHVLLVEPSEHERNRLATALLQAAELDIFEAAGAQEGLHRALREPFDLILVSAGLPAPGAVPLLKALRVQGVLCPLLVMAHGGIGPDEDMLVRAFDAGANDVFAETASSAALTARVRAHLRHAEGSESATLAIGPFMLVPMKKTVTRADGSIQRLTGKEVEILRHLHRARGTTVARKALLEEIWGYNTRVNTHTLETHIYRLRRKLETDPTAPRLIVTERGGYRLSGVGEDAAVA